MERRKMIDAMIHWEKDGIGFGTHRFDVLPSPGDRLVVGNNRGSNDILIVDYVEHHPVRLPVSPNARPDPYVRICASYHSSFGD